MCTSGPSCAEEPSPPFHATKRGPLAPARRGSSCACRRRTWGVEVEGSDHGCRRLFHFDAGYSVVEGGPRSVRSCPKQKEAKRPKRGEMTHDANQTEAAASRRVAGFNTRAGRDPGDTDAERCCYCFAGPRPAAIKAREATDG